jgi:hypothetical protein
MSRDECLLLQPAASVDESPSDPCSTVRVQRVRKLYCSAADDADASWTSLVPQKFPRRRANDDRPERMPTHDMLAGGWGY